MSSAAHTHLDRQDVPIRRRLVALGVGISKTSVFGTTPWKSSLQVWKYVVSPDTFEPDSQIRFQITPVIPLPW